MAALELHMKIWPAIKIILIIVASVGAMFDTSYSEVGDEIGWDPVIVGLLFFPCIVVAGLLILKVILRKKLEIQLSSWESNPLDFSHPEHFFQFAAVVLVVSGICGLIAAYFRSGGLTPVLLSPVAMGVGVLLGIWILKVAYVAQQ